MLGSPALSRATLRHTLMTIYVTNSKVMSCTGAHNDCHMVAAPAAQIADASTLTDWKTCQTLRIAIGSKSSSGTPSQRRMLWMSANGRVTRSRNAKPQLNGARPSNRRCISSPSGPHPNAYNAASHRKWAYSIIQATRLVPNRKNTSANRTFKTNTLAKPNCSVSAETKKAVPFRERLLKNIKPGGVLLSHGETPHYHRR